MMSNITVVCINQCLRHSIVLLLLFNDPVSSSEMFVSRDKHFAPVFSIIYSIQVPVLCYARLWGWITRDFKGLLLRFWPLHNQEPNFIQIYFEAFQSSLLLNKWSSKRLLVVWGAASWYSLNPLSVVCCNIWIIDGDWSMMHAAHFQLHISQCSHLPGLFNQSEHSAHHSANQSRDQLHMT